MLVHRSLVNKLYTLVQPFHYALVPHRMRLVCENRGWDELLVEYDKFVEWLNESDDECIRLDLDTMQDVWSFVDQKLVHIALISCTDLYDNDRDNLKVMVLLANAMHDRPDKWCRSDMNRLVIEQTMEI